MNKEVIWECLICNEVVEENEMCKCIRDYIDKHKIERFHKLK